MTIAPSRNACSTSRGLYNSVGDRAEYKQLLAHTLKLWREWEDDLRVADTSRFIADANRWLGLLKEGIQQAREALEIYKWLNNTLGQSQSWQLLAWLLYFDKQLDAAEEAASQVINSGDDQFTTCQCHRLLGDIYLSKGGTEKAINHFEIALRIASHFNWHDQLVLNHISLAQLFSEEGRFDDAHTHTKRAKSHAINFPYLLARAMCLQAKSWHEQGRLGEAKSEVLRAVDVFVKLGATDDLQPCRARLRDIEATIDKREASHE